MLTYMSRVNIDYYPLFVILLSSKDCLHNTRSPQMQQYKNGLENVAFCSTTIFSLAQQLLPSETTYQIYSIYP